MNGRTRKVLESKRKQKVDQVVVKLLSSDPPPDIKPDLDEIDQYCRIIDQTKPRWTPDSRLAVVVAMVCVSIAAFLWISPIPKTNISLALDTESVRGEFARDWEFKRSFKSPAMHIERLSTIEAPNLGLSIHEAQGDAWLKVDGGQLEIQSIEIRQNCTLEAVSSEGIVDLFLGNSPLDGKMTVRGHVTVSAGPRDGQKSLEKQFDIPIPETIIFSVTNSSGVPAQVTIHSPADWSLSSVPLSNISFSMEQPTEAAERILTSGVRSGTLQFNDTSWGPLQLPENEFLAIHQSANARIDLRSTKGLVHATINGQVKDVTLGDERSKRVLVPSYLEYFYNRKSLAFFWGAIVFLWGALWSIRKIMFR
jgi:hypothetical protein